MGVTLWRQISATFCLSFTLDNDFYRQLRCHRSASNLLFWPWNFSEFYKMSRKPLIFGRVACNVLMSVRPSVNISRLPICWDQISETVCHLPSIMTSTDSWDAVDVHPICYIDLDIFSTFLKGHENLWFFNLRPWMGATLWGPVLRSCWAVLAIYLRKCMYNDFYRQLRCRICASNLLFGPWHFFDLSKRSQTTFIFELNTLDGCHFVGTRSKKLCAIYLR